MSSLQQLQRTYIATYNSLWNVTPCFYRGTCWIVKPLLRHQACFPCEFFFFLSCGKCKSVALLFLLSWRYSCPCLIFLVHFALCNLWGCLFMRSSVVELPQLIFTKQFFVKHKDCALFAFIWYINKMEICFPNLFVFITARYFFFQVHF